MEMNIITTNECAEWGARRERVSKRGKRDRDGQRVKNKNETDKSKSEREECVRNKARFFVLLAIAQTEQHMLI